MKSSNLNRLPPGRPPKIATASGSTAPNNLPSAHAPVASCAGCAWAAGATNPARVTGTTSARSPTPTSTTTPTAPPPSSRPHSMLSMLIDMHMLLALFILALQMHTDMGDERGSGCAASRWGAPPFGDHGCVAWPFAAKSRNLVLPDPLSRSLVLVWR